LPKVFAPVAPKIRDEIPSWLEQWKLDRFVTLAANCGNLPGRELASHDDRLTGLLKEWDGRMNRKLAGTEMVKGPRRPTLGILLLGKARGDPALAQLDRADAASRHA
jgi:hypothetical protein